MVKRASELVAGDIVEIAGEERMVEFTYANSDGKTTTIKLVEEGIQNYNLDHLKVKSHAEIIVIG